MCRGVQVRQNKDVSRCNSVGIVIHKVISWVVDGLRDVDGFVDRVVDNWEVRKRLRGLYPIKNADFVIAF